jgi:hypothetical protein
MLETVLRIVNFRSYYVLHRMIVLKYCGVEI